LEDARRGNREVFFVDAAHFVWQGFIGFLWCFTRVWFGSPTGRQRFNVLGALNAVTHEVIAVCNTTYINSDSLWELLFKLRKRFLLTGIPISIVLDNAAYQRSYRVVHLAQLMGIELLFMPPYSPNLNLIERLWKFVKGQCLHAKEYKNFKDFHETIQKTIETAHVEHKSKLASLLTWNFQCFDDIKKAA
jgi:transposase